MARGLTAPREPVVVGPFEVESLDHEGQGVAHHDGKVVFIEGALPGERVTATLRRRKPKFDTATVHTVLRASPLRVTPPCPHFGICGGCSLQHLDARAQVAMKQRVLEDTLAHLGQVAPQEWLAPIHGETWGYRQRARLSVRNVVKKGRVLVGFHERRSSYVAEMDSCAVLPERISAAIAPLATLIAGLSIRDRLPQIEVAVGDRVDVLVLRHLAPLTDADRAALVAFAEARGVSIQLQSGGPDTVVPLHPPTPAALDYALPEFDVVLPFAPSEFTQVNHAVNRVLVRRAMQLLAPRAGEHVADLFCGLGNFTLPIARAGAQVLGIEGSAALVRRAVEGAALNGLAERTRFEVANLFEVTTDDVQRWGALDAALIDPPRDGALALVKALLPEVAPKRLVYVSCNPATLARDAGVLVHVQGYTLTHAGVANMFPHTAHVESIARFERA
jgi:23S rRNA (uracil1939-C5)-methyltransferase